VPRLHQIQFRYVPQEDRILLRIKTTERSEFRFWLTRRYVKLLWPVVVKMLESDQRVQLQPTAEAKSAVLSFQHEKAIRKSDFSTQYREDAAELPLGESPVVLAKIQIKKAGSSGDLLCVHPESGKGIELAMNETLLHSFSKLLTDAIKVSEWDFEPRLPKHPGDDTAAPERVN
jgi:hypothetical protein